MEHTKWYVTKDYYGGVRISTVPTDATNIDGSGSIFENTGRGAGDIAAEDAQRIALCCNAHEGLVGALKKIVDYMRHPPCDMSMTDNLLTGNKLVKEAEQALKQAQADNSTPDGS